MEAPRADTDEAEAHRGKYARVERERRFLVSELPADHAVRIRRIVDRYFVGTRLRLRLTEDIEPATDTSVYKLTQKIPGLATGEGEGLITNIHLSGPEYELLRGIPGTELRKMRHIVPPMGIDVFEDTLSGLIIAEAEFGSANEMRSFKPPAYTVAEVTEDQRFTGGRLVFATRQELASWLNEYGIRRSSLG